MFNCRFKLVKLQASINFTGELMENLEFNQCLKVKEVTVKKMFAPWIFLFLFCA